MLIIVSGCAYIITDFPKTFKFHLEIKENVVSKLIPQNEKVSMEKNTNAVRGMN